MAQSVYERERLVEVNRLLPDIRDFLRDVIKKESLSSEIIEQCDGYIERLDAIIQPPSLPPRSGRSATVSYNDSSSNDFLHPKVSEQLPKGNESTDIKPSDHGVSPEYLEQQRELSRKATMWMNEQPNQQSPYNSQRKQVKTVQLRNDVTSDNKRDPKAIIQTDARQSAIYEKILSTSNSTEQDVSNSGIKPAPTKLAEPPPVPERKGRSTTVFDKQNNEKATVMVHDLKDPLYSGLLRNVRVNIKQWGVIMSQKLYLFNDLEKPADFIGDLRFYEVMKDPMIKNVFRVTGSDSNSIMLAAVNDAQYQLWYSAFQRAKLLSDAAVGKFGGSGEMAEYVSIGDEDFDENDYEQPNDLLGNALLNKQKPPSESYVPITYPRVSTNNPPNGSSSSIVYEIMDETPTEQLDPSILQVIEREDSWQSHESFSCAAIEDPEDQDYTCLPLPPLPPPSEDVPPELPVRGHKVTSSIGGTSIGSTSIGGISMEGISLGGKLYNKSEDEASLSDNLANGSMQSLDSESDNDVRPIIKSRSPSLKTSSLPSNSKLKRMRENEFFSDESAFTGVLHKRKILAVWQKHYCKVKDENLICFRNLDNAEASYKINLPGYQLDRADETWRKFAFKLHNDSDVLYFAAENRADLVKWLNVLAKEMNKERFIAMKDPDTLDMPRQKNLVRQESTDESEGSQPNVDQSKQDDINDHTSDFDADNESGGSEASEKKISITEQLPKNFLQVSKNRRMRGREEDSPEEPDAQIQGYLFRKFQNHWTCRWCSIKDKKFFIYRHSPRELPETVVILEFAALTIPHDDGVTRSGGWHLFKITYEAEQVILLSTKSKEDWFSWTKCIEDFVGSLSEEPFPYINVPASSTLQKNINCQFFPTDEDEVDDFNSFAPEAVSSPLDGHDFTTSELNPSSVPAGKSDILQIPRRENELDESYYYGYLTEIQVLGNKIEHVELFVVLSKEKVLKFYSDKEDQVPLNVYNALNTEVINEAGADPCVLRLNFMDENKEIMLKAHDQIICEEWKENLNIIHYAEIDDNLGNQRGSTDFSYGVDKTVHDKMFRKRSKSIDKKPKNEPVLISHVAYRTLPQMGRNKKRAKEQNNTTAKSKRLSYQRSEDSSIPSKKGISSFIRSFTVDTLGRKAKNKSFEFSNDILLKETQHGHVTEVVITKSSVTHENRYCRISGKVLYCYSCKNDVKHIWKVPLKNAAIEDDVDSNNLFKIKITALDSGEEYNLLLDSEVDLDNWVSALSGEDKLHYSSSSPQIARNDGVKSPTVMKVRRDGLDVIPPPPRKDTNELSLPIRRRDAMELSPTIPTRVSNRDLPKPNADDSPISTERKHLPGTAIAINKKTLSSSISNESPPVPKRLASREPKCYDVEDTPAISGKKTITPSLSSESPRVPKRMQSRASYKTKADDDSIASMDRIPLSGNTNGISKKQLSHTRSNDQEVTLLLETSPPVPRRMKSKEVPKSDTFDDSPALTEHINLTSAVNTNDKKPLTPTVSNTQEIQDALDVPFVVNKDISMETSKHLIISTNDVEIDGPTKWFSAYSGSLSSLSSSNTTSTLSSTITTSTLSETEILSLSKSKEQKLSEDDVLLEEFMNEIRQKELSKTKVLRWLVLRKSVLEVYTSEREKTPCKIINMENSSLVSNEKTSTSSQLTIRLKDSEGFITEFLPQTSSVYKKWVSQIKSIEKRFRRISKINTKLPIVGDIIRRRDRSDRIKNLRSDDDKRKSLLLVEDDFKAVQKYEESTDLSRTISGPLVEYFDDDKPDEKNRHCWIKDGFFYVAKASKILKAIKKIDLSTVVILDESDPSKHSYAFKLNYTKDNKERCIMLKAPNQNTADKWMVSVSMGILLHRLKSPQIRTSFEIEEPCDKDHEFVQLPSSIALTITTPTYPSHADDFELGIDIKREIAKKAEHGEEHLMNMSELLQTEFPTPNDSPLLNRKEELIEKISIVEETDGVVTKNENIEIGELKINENQLTPEAARFSNLPCSDDVVFSDTEESLEMLENIPDRDNADERFKNVRGILKQQESIRRAIIHRQKSNASQKVPPKKRIPPKTKPKPKSTTSVSSISNNKTKNSINSSFDKIKESFVVLKESVSDLSMTDLQTYNAQLESEKITLHNFIKVIDKDIKKNDTYEVDQSTIEVALPTDTNGECTDLLLAQDRLQMVTSELNRAHSQITRCVSMKIGGKVRDSGLYNSGQSKLYGSVECLLPIDRQSHLYEKGYNSEPLYNEDDIRKSDRSRSYDETNSIII